VLAGLQQHHEGGECHGSFGAPLCERTLLSYSHASVLSSRVLLLLFHSSSFDRLQGTVRWHVRSGVCLDILRSKAGEH
jgi:hypothetical protein